MRGRACFTQAQRTRKPTSTYPNTLKLMKKNTVNCVLCGLLAFTFGTAATQARVYQEVAGRVVIEAENFFRRTTNLVTGREWKIIPDEDPAADTYRNARGKYLRALPDAGENRNAVDLVGTDALLEYKVALTRPGAYRLWLRWTGHDGGSDSIYAELLDPTGTRLTPLWYRYASGEGHPADSDFATKVSDGSVGWDGTAEPENVGPSPRGGPAVWTVPAAGTYTIRISQREDGAALDALILQLDTLPAPQDPGPPESPLVGAPLPPLTLMVVPAAGSLTAPYDKPISAIFFDGTTKLDLPSVALEFNGVKVPHTATRVGEMTTVSYTPPAFLPPRSRHTAKVTYKDDKGDSFTYEWSFTVRYYVLVPAAWAVTPDRTKPGFIWNVHQNRDVPVDRPWLADARLAGLILGPDGLPLENRADHLALGCAIGPARPASPPWAPITFEIAGVVNMSQTEFSNHGHFHPDEQMPGIPSIDFSTDDISGELLTFIELPAGNITMSINSDDGFATYVTPGDPRDRFGLLLDTHPLPRGAASTEFTFVVEKAGVYAFRTVWYERSGDANIEWYIRLPDAARTRVLVNDRATPGAPASFRAATGLVAPYARAVVPAPGATGVDPDTEIRIELVETAAARVAVDSVRLKLNDIALTPTVTKVGDVTTIVMPSTTLLPSRSTNTVDLSFSYGTPAIAVTRSWTFTVADYGILPVALGTVLGSGVDAKPGFRVRTHQVEATQPNSDVRAERQLAGLVGPDISDKTGVGPDGYFVVSDFINFNQDAPGPGGNFHSGVDIRFEDKPIPGIPGITWSTDNFAQEILTYVEFPAPGLYRMGVNSDDGFKVTVAEGADPTAVRLGIFDGSRGFADTLFVFVVEAAGVYPLRLIWYEGEGGAGVEWFMVKGGKRVLLNDRTDPIGLKAFRERRMVPIVIEPPKFTSIHRVAGNIVLEWTGGGTLQTAPVVSGPWVDVAGAASPYTIAITESMRFWRVRR